MSFTGLSNIRERLGQRRSLDVSAPTKGPKQENGDEFVIVDESLQDSDGSQVLTESGGKDSRLSSPGPVSLHLEVPEDASSEMSINAQIDLHNEAMLPDWKTHPLCSGSHHAASGDLDGEAYISSLEAGATGNLDGKNEALQQALEEANQQHEWAMKAVIRGWETEKADLLSKLEKTTEARDTLEAELKHSESNFAGMLDGILDQKLDQMLQMLQENGVSPHTPSSARSSFGGASRSPNQQPTVRKAQQVVNDLGGMLDAMKDQQAAVEERVAGLQDAILQLLPEDADGSYGDLRRDAVLDRAHAGRDDNRIKASFRKMGGVINRSRSYTTKKVPKWFQASRSFAIGTIQIPVTFTKQAAQRVHHYCQQKGLGQEFFTTLAGILAGVLVSSLLVKSLGRKPLKQIREEEQREEPAESTDIIEFTKEAPEQGQEEKNNSGECMHIILSNNGVYKRTTYESSPSLMFAWPKIVVDYK